MTTRNDNEIETEVTAVLTDRERLAQEQRAVRRARLNEPAMDEWGPEEPLEVDGWLPDMDEWGPEEPLEVDGWR